MKLIDLFQALRRSVSRYGLEFAKGQTRQPSLSPYKDALAVLDALDGARLSVEERIALVRALLDEEQRHAHPLWLAMLHVAFAPMLVALRRRARPRYDEDLDQEILLAFVDAIAAMPPAASIECPILAVRRATARPFYETARAEEAARRRRFRKGEDDEKRAPKAQDQRNDERVEPSASVEVIDATDDALALCEAKRRHEAAMAWAGGDEELIDMMLATSGGGATLRQFVDARYATEPPEARDAAYWRLLRARRRLESELRAMTT